MSDKLINALLDSAFIADRAVFELNTARHLLYRAHAVMRRCHWNEPTGLEGDEDSALQVERDVREFLGK